jgi:hypothetical protein
MKLVFTEEDIERIARETYEATLPGFAWDNITADSIFNRAFFIRCRTALSVASDLE